MKIWIEKRCFLFLCACCSDENRERLLRLLQISIRLNSRMFADSVWFWVSGFAIMVCVCDGRWMVQMFAKLCICELFHCKYISLQWLSAVKSQMNTPFELFPVSYDHYSTLGWALLKFTSDIIARFQACTSWYRGRNNNKKWRKRFRDRNARRLHSVCLNDAQLVDICLSQCKKNKTKQNAAVGCDFATEYYVHDRNTYRTNTICLYNAQLTQQFLANAIKNTNCGSWTRFRH